jgi:hypothetical protein
MLPSLDATRFLQARHGTQVMSPSLADVKKALLAAGFEVYRTIGSEVQVADRVRDNLIMDSGVSVRAESSLAVRVVVRAQLSDFPADTPESLLDRARAAAAFVVSRGYLEIEAQETPIRDPVDPARTLDTWYEVCYERKVDLLDEAMVEVGFALKIEKTARRSYAPPR